MSSDRRAISLPVAEVTVLEDRALVRRRGRVTVEAGRARLRVSGVSPIVVDKSLLGDLSASDARLVDARVVRERVAADDVRGDDVRALNEEIALDKAGVVALEDRMRALKAECDALAARLSSLAVELAVDASWGRVVTSPRGELFGRLVTRDLEARAAVAALDVELDDARQALARKIDRSRASKRLDSSLVASLDLDVEAKEPCEVELVVSYVVPNACWRPRHRAVLGEGKVAFQTEAVVWQNTGEAWSEVELSLSTERPSLGVEPPRLEADPLSVTKRGALVVETRQEEVERAGAGGGGKRVVSELPGIDDGGEARSMRAPHRATIASDGRPHAVALGAFEAEAEVGLVCLPELLLAAVTKATFLNAGRVPLLPGPVELVRGGGPVGRGSLEFVAPGEKLELGFGPDGSVRVHREIEPLKDETSMLGSWVTKTHDVRLRLSNLGPFPRSVVVQERVTLSEIEKVQVSVSREETSGQKVPDENGFVTWRVELPPLGRSELKLRVITKRHGDVVGG